MEKSLNIETIFLSIGTLLLEIIIVFLFFTTKPKKKELKIIAGYVFYSLFSVVIINDLISKVSHKEFLGFRIFTIVEGIILAYFLATIISNITAKRVLAVIVLLFVVYSVFDLSQSNSDTFDSIPTVIECLILISFSVFYFFEQLKNPDSLFLYNTPTFWIVVGIILFFSGNFFVFIYAQSNSKSPEFKQTFALINAILAFIENILFLIAFLIAKNQSKTVKPNIIAKN